MLPEIPLAEIENDGERLVYQGLKDQVPDDWTVRYNYPVCWHLDGYLQDFEIDFIVVAPSRGILFLEIKSSYAFECAGAAWYRVKRNGQREKTRSPIDQVTAAKHNVVKKIAKQVFRTEKNKFPGIFGHLVIYPKGELRGGLPHSIAPELIATRRNMPILPQTLERSFSHWGSNEQGHKFSNNKARLVTEFLQDDCRFVQVLAADVDEDENHIEKLTRNQFAAFRHLLAMPRVAVSGPAGSGKTMIAQWIAVTYQQKGKKVLLLCYNRVLEAWIRQSAPQDSFEIRSFFSLCREWVTEAGMPFDVPAGPSAEDDFWQIEAPELLYAVTDDANETDKYDVILVDEAQDFHENWWMPVQLLLKDPDEGGLYMFRDSNQSGVYGHGTKYPSRGVFEVSLTENCRNTKAINSYCANVIDSQIASDATAPIGAIPEICQPIPEISARAKAVKRIVNGLIEEGFDPSQIAILSPFKPAKPSSTLSQLNQINNFSLKGRKEEVEHWMSGQCLWASTIKSFKGLEAACVIITDLSPIGGNFTHSDLYVACSRAKHRLYLLPTVAEGFAYLNSHLAQTDLR
mgnify:CR=1 FL=1